MDLALKYKVVVSIFAFIFHNSHAVTWNENYEHDIVKDPLHYPSLSETYDSFLGDKGFVRTISKRSANWSNRRSRELLSPSPSKLDEQESENVEITTQMPRIVRKMRFQNMPHQARFKEQNGINLEKGKNDSTFDQKGRIVRVRKFRRRTTTEKPKTTTIVTSITSTQPSRLRSITPQMTQYSHITVINKEVIDQKPNRKNKSKQASLWLPSESFSESKQTVINDVTIPPHPIESNLKKQNMDSTHKNAPNKNRGYRSSEASKRSDSDPKHISDVNTRPMTPKDMTPKSSGENRDLNLQTKSRTSVDEIKKKPQNHRSILEKPFQSKKISDLKRLDPPQIKDDTQHSNNTSTTREPKSVEIMSDVPKTENDDPSLAIPQPYVQYNNNANEMASESPLLSDPIVRPNLSQTDLQPGQVLPNMGFGHYPQQAFQNYPYGVMNPFFRPPGAQPPGIQPPNGSPLTPTSFHRPYSPFYAQNDPQFPDYYSAPHFTPYQRSGSLRTPEFYHSPQLASLRRSIIGAYAEEEPMESTTEFSLPKFEIPSIDFNDKGCRTVYKEVSALPGGNENPRSAENKAKSFVMTRECFFPDGVPTTSPVNEKEQVDGTTPATKQNFNSQ